MPPKEASEFDPALYFENPAVDGRSAGFSPRFNKPCGVCGTDIFVVVRLQNRGMKPPDLPRSVCPVCYSGRFHEDDILGRHYLLTGVVEMYQHEGDYGP